MSQPLPPPDRSLLPPTRAQEDAPLTIDQCVRSLIAEGATLRGETQHVIWRLESCVRAAVRAECRQLQEHRELGDAILRRLKA